MRKLLYIIFATFLLLQSCRTTQEVVKTEVVEVPRIEHHYQSTHQRDTIIERDSVIILQKGDTIYHHTHHFTKKVVELHDTVHHTDTVTVVEPVEITQTKYIEKQLTPWQIVRLNFANLILLAIGGLLALKLIAFVGRKWGWF